ncbi:MAG: acyl-CoA thioesterase [Chloroflexota bacterium]
MTSVSKTVAETRFSLSALMNPRDANPLGNVHGGAIMKLVDEAGAIVAMRHAGYPVVTVAIDSMTFLEPIRVGNLVTCEATVTFVGQTSIETRVEVIAENPYEGSRTTANVAHLVYVALGNNGRPVKVPALEIVTEVEKEREQLAAERQRLRRQRRDEERMSGGNGR